MSTAVNFDLKLRNKTTPYNPTELRTLSRAVNGTNVLGSVVSLFDWPVADPEKTNALIKHDMKTLKILNNKFKSDYTTIEKLTDDLLKNFPISRWRFSRFQRDKHWLAYVAKLTHERVAWCAYTEKVFRSKPYEH